MTTRISTNNLDSSVTVNFSPKISGIAISDNSYTVLDDTAVSVSGGYIVISGSNFATGCTVLIGSVVATSVSFVNSTTVRAQVPAQAAGSYTVYVTNPDGGLAIRVNGLNYSATPTWSTTSPLPSGQINSTINIQLAATSNGNVSYALQAGSSLPAGVTLSNVGLLSGTVTGITTDTTYNFTVVATDTELQDTPQAFSITITANDQYFKNTTLLLSANTPGTTFVTDASTNAFNVSILGDTRPNNFSPYLGGYYSNYFDGTGDYLQTPSDVAFNITGINAYTIECWFYATALPAALKALVTSFNGSNGGSFWMGIDASNKMNVRTGNDASVVSGTTTIVTGQWYHMALVRDGATSMKGYLNGVLEVSSTSFSWTGQTQACFIGSYSGGTGPFTGYISNARVVNGTTVYTGAFTPSTAPLTAITNTSLLTCQSATFIDNSTNNFAITRNGDTRIDGFVPYTPAAGTSTYGSAYFDGTGDYINIPASVNLNLGSGNFTVECYMYFNQAIAGPQSFLSQSAVNSNGFAFGFNGSSYYLWWYANGGAVINSSSQVIIGMWNHLAVVRSGSTLTMYINGVSAGTATDNISYGGSSMFYIGSDEYNQYFRGYLSGIRIVKGTAVYTSNFTPPTAPLTAIANTSLLTLQTNQPVNNNQFVDRSTNNFLITRNGNATPGSFSPYAGGWSNYFDGTGDYLSVATNAAFSFGTGDFTVEFWAYYPPVSNTNGKMVVDSRPASTNGSYWNFGITNVGIMAFTTMTIGGATVSDTITRSNQWVHYAATRSGTSLRLFANGTQVASATNSDNISSSGLFIGTNAFSGTATDTFYLGYISNLRIIKGTALYTANFTPSTAPLLPITNTSLLTCADNRFVDDSPNNFAITRNGDVSVQKFSPFSMQTQTVPTSYSVFFDGTGDYLRTTGSVLNNSAFTISFYFYPTTSNVIGLFDSGPAQASTFRNYPANAIEDQNGGRVSFTPLVNQWNWMSIIGDGTNFTVHLNGSSVGSAAYASLVNNNFTIGTINSGGDGAYTGYISNFRVKNIASVDAVPSVPLTAVANTTLLTCQSTTLIDNSANAFAITANGDVRPIPVNPFGYTNPAAGAYTVTALGGSMYFDGTGDWLSIPNASTPIGTGDFTVECWVYPTALGSFDGFISSAMDGGGALGISLSRDQAWIGNNSTIAVNYNWSASILVGRWQHLAVTRSGTTVRFFVNGVLLSSGTASTNMNSTQYAIGRRYPNYADYYPTGYISDARVITGSALYTSNFVPPAAPLDPVRNTVLLLRGTAAGVYDSTMINNLETVGDARINTSVVKFAGKPSMYFDGTGDYLTIPYNPIHQMVNEDLTIEAWVYRNVTGAEHNIAVTRSSAGNDGWNVRINSSNTLQFYFTGGGSVTSTGTIPATTWTHIAVVKSGNSAKLYINGVNDGTNAAIGTGNSNSQPLRIGVDNSNSTGYMNGYISDLRITKGVARYTTNFTAPTSPSIQY